MYRFTIFFVTIMLPAICISQTSDEIAITGLLERESATWRAGDIKAHAACWHIQPYSRILVSIGDSVLYDVPPQMMITPAANMVGKGGTAINKNIKMNIAGGHAWVSHDEESTSKDGVKTYSAEFRILEKIGGQWKLVAQSIHIYKIKK